MQDVTCFGRSLLLCLWSPWGWEEAPFSPCLCWHSPPQSHCFQEFAQAGSCSSLLSLSFGARCNLHISAPRGCNAWGQEPAHVLWSVCRIQVLRRERDLLRRWCSLGVSTPGRTRLLSHKNRWCLRGPSRPGILAILPWAASEGWVLLSTVCIRGL